MAPRRPCNRLPLCRIVSIFVVDRFYDKQPSIISQLEKFPQTTQEIVASARPLCGSLRQRGLRGVHTVRVVVVVVRCCNVMQKSFTRCGRNSLEVRTCVTIGLGGLQSSKKPIRDSLSRCRVQTVLQIVHSTCIQCTLIQTFPPFDSTSAAHCTDA